MEQNYNHDKITENNQGNLLTLLNLQRRVRKDPRIKIDISRTEYPLLRNVCCNELGWKVWTREESKEEINVYWVDTYVSQELVRRMKNYQRINHFPGSEQLGKKNLLTASISRLKKLMPRDFAFYPQAFNFPNQIEDFERFAKSRQQQYFIVKPTSDSQGRGIYLTQTVDLASKQQMVVQQYIANPLLLEGMKFDLRIYVLVRSIVPLKIYIYHQGLSRLATCSYEKPDSGNKKNMRMHLTNYAINKFSPNFIFNKSQEEDHVGHKRSYTSTMQAIERLGCDVAALQSEIDKIIVKTIMATYQHLEKKYKEVRDIRQQSESICFQVLGFDILIKQNFEPLLLQVNHSPSFSTDSPLDMIIKKCLILDTLNLLNLNHQDKITYFKNKNDHDPLYSPLQISRNNRSYSSQPEELGAYRKIYPLESTPENQEINKLYEAVFKNCKLQKLARPNRHILSLNNKMADNKQELEKIRKSTSNDQEEKSFSLYNVINNLKINRLRKIADNSDLLQPEDPLQDKGDLFQTGIDTELIRKEELMSYQRKIRKDKQKQKKKYVLPMQLNNISIKLDQKFMHPKREAKSTNTAHYFSPDTNYFKIHSLFSNKSNGPQIATDRPSDKGNQTAEGLGRLPNFDTFRRTHLAAFSHLPDDSKYSNQLKLKLQRMHFVRLRIQKSKKPEKGVSVVVNNKSMQKRASQFYIPNDQRFL